MSIPKVPKAPKLSGSRKSSSSTKIPNSVAPFCLQYILEEIKGGRSSLILAFAGTMHLNDFLHQAGLITDDCWNNVKGEANLFSNTAVITAIAGSVGSVLKTVVEGVTTVTGQEAKTAQVGMQQATKLAEIAGAEAVAGA
jgi:hypothetical protein